MESIEKLRKYSFNGTVKLDLKTLQYKQTVDDLMSIADEIEAEIAEKYMLLPVDADGVPIHVGDMLNWEYEEEKFTVCAVAPGRVHHWVQQDGKRSTVDYPPTQCTHYKPRTIEDVLESFLVDYDTWDVDCKVDRLGERRLLFAKYADELRGMMEGE